MILKAVMGSFLTAAVGRCPSGRLSAALLGELQPTRAHRRTNDSVRKSMCLRHGALAIGLKRLGKTMMISISDIDFFTAPIREECFSELFSQVRNLTEVLTT